MPECSSCGRGTEPSWRYCPWCATPQRLKLVELFPSHPAIEPDRPRALRVSRYLGGSDDERHVRFSLWADVSEQTTVVESAVSLAEKEAERLALFLLSASPREDAGARRPQVAEDERAGRY
jgi:hypothetical protein